jgi:hypothetical protein
MVAEGTDISATWAVGLMKDYHEEVLRYELFRFNKFMCRKQYDGRIPLIGTCIDEYLKSKL